LSGTPRFFASLCNYHKTTKSDIFSHNEIIPRTILYNIENIERAHTLFCKKQESADWQNRYPFLGFSKFRKIPDRKETVVSLLSERHEMMFSVS
jgi:hypothetical protein